MNSRGQWPIASHLEVSISSNNQVGLLFWQLQSNDQGPMQSDEREQSLSDREQPDALERDSSSFAVSIGGIPTGVSLRFSWLSFLAAHSLLFVGPWIIRSLFG